MINDRLLVIIVFLTFFSTTYNGLPPLFLSFFLVLFDGFENFIYGEFRLKISGHTGVSKNTVRRI